MNQVLLVPMKMKIKVPILKEEMIQIRRKMRMTFKNSQKKMMEAKRKSTPL